MNNKQIITTGDAPKAIGTYSQAVRVGSTVYLSGQIPLDPVSAVLVSEDFCEQAHQVFKNLQAVCKAAGAELDQIVKLNFYLCDLNQFALLNEIMSQYFTQPYPARAAVGVSALPKGAQLEADGILHLDEGFSV